MDYTVRTGVLWKICFLMALCTISVVLATVPQPRNVRVNSINMNVVLEWDPPHPSPGNLTYTARYTPAYSSLSTTVCQNQSKESCDFTKDLNSFGIYTFHVRAEFQRETSDWVNTTEFSIDKHTLIGAPTVRLSSKEGNLEVDIQDPVPKDLLRRVYSGVCYNVRYWKENELERATELNCEQQSNLVLSELKPRTRYCVEAQVFVPSRDVSNFSRVVCETTTAGRAAPGLIVAVMLCSLVVVAVVVLLVFLIGWYGYKGMKFLFPKAKIPEHFKQYLSDPPHSYILQAMQNSSLPEEKCHEVSILSELTQDLEPGEGTSL